MEQAPPPQAASDSRSAVAINGFVFCMIAFCVRDCIAPARQARRFAGNLAWGNSPPEMTTVHDGSRDTSLFVRPQGHDKLAPLAAKVLEFVQKRRQERRRNLSSYPPGSAGAVGHQHRASRDDCAQLSRSSESIKNAHRIEFHVLAKAAVT